MDKPKNITTEKEAIEYLEKVLTWRKWRLHHKSLVRALEILLPKLKKRDKKI